MLDGAVSEECDQLPCHDSVLNGFCEVSRGWLVQVGQLGAHSAVRTLPAPAVQLAHGERQLALQAAPGLEPAPRVAAQDLELSVDGLGGVGGGQGGPHAAGAAQERKQVPAVSAQVGDPSPVAGREALA